MGTTCALARVGRGVSCCGRLPSKIDYYELRHACPRGSRRFRDRVDQARRFRDVSAAELERIGFCDDDTILADLSGGVVGRSVVDDLHSEVVVSVAD